MKTFRKTTGYILVLAILLTLPGCPLKHSSYENQDRLYHTLDNDYKKDHYYTWIGMTGTVTYFTVFDTQVFKKRFTSFAVNNQRLFLNSSAPWQRTYSHRGLKPGYFKLSNQDAEIIMCVADVSKMSIVREMGDESCDVAYKEDGTPLIYNQVVELTNLSGKTFMVEVPTTLAKSLVNMDAFVFTAYNELTEKYERYTVPNEKLVKIEFDDTEENADPHWEATPDAVWHSGLVRE